jgi:hypothetical protein
MIHLVTVATNETDGFKRFQESALTHNFSFTTLGMGEKWNWDSLHNTGGGQKVRLLKQYLNTIEDESALILFTDSYDVIINDSPQSIFNKFHQFSTDIIFAAESLIWPDENLAPLFPKNPSPYIYLNSGGFIGSVKALKQITQTPISDSEDDQYYYHKVFLFNSKPRMMLDYNCVIFQTLSALFDDVDIDGHKILNNRFGTYPSIIHGNGGIRSKLFLNKLGNYVPKKPIAHFPVPEEYTITYFINTNDQNDFPDGILYSRTNSNSPNYTPTENDVKNLLISILETNNSDYYFLTDSHHILDPNVIPKLIATGKNIIAPMLVSGTSELFTNFWGGVDSSGYYVRSWDYVDIATYEKKGIWNVPHISSSILISKNVVGLMIEELKNNEIEDEDFDMYFSRILRYKGIFMYVMNFESYGKIIESEIV